MHVSSLNQASGYGTNIYDILYVVVSESRKIYALKIYMHHEELNPPEQRLC